MKALFSLVVTLTIIGAFAVVFAIIIYLGEAWGVIVPFLIVWMVVHCMIEDKGPKS